MKKRIKHNLNPIYDKNTKVLILGSLPSVKSREGEFYYHHPRNRFWQVISFLLEEELPVTIDGKNDLLLNNCIGLWDVIKSCEIEGSADSTIRDVEVNDLSKILDQSQISMILANGGVAYELYNKHIIGKTKKEIIKLPSTSPANAIYSLDRLLEEWEIVKEALL